MTVCIPGIARERARRNPDRVFCRVLSRDSCETVTYSRLIACSGAFAIHLTRLGVKRDGVVPIMLRHTPHLYYAYLGAMMIGALPTFMPLPSPKQRHELYIQEHERLFTVIEPAVIVAEKEVADRFKRACLTPDEVMLENDHRLNPLGPLNETPDEVACLQHSSGTTALKKGVALTHRAIIEQVEAYSKALKLSTDDVIASWLPLYHDMGFVACFMMPLITGSAVVTLDPFEWVAKPTLLLDAIEKYRATLCWLPNFAFSHIVNTAPPTSDWDLSSMRAFMNCSEPCKPRTFERFLERFAQSGVRSEMLQVCYAMAENVFAVTQTAIDLAPRVLTVDGEQLATGAVQAATPGASSARMLSCGKPLDGVRIRILDSVGADLGEGHVGEVVISSPYLFSGYYRLPQETSRKLKDGWYWTGDLGFLYEGELYITGRIDDLLLLNGRNYYAHEIEDIVYEVEGVVPGRALALTVEDERTDAAGLVILAECVEDAEPSDVARRVRAMLSERAGLGLYAFEPVRRGSLVKSTSGKISRSKNKELYLSGAL